MTAISGLIATGVATRPTKAVKTTSDMTRGFSSAKKSPAVASDMRMPDFVQSVVVDHGHAYEFQSLRLAKAAGSSRRPCLFCSAVT